MSNEPVKVPVTEKVSTKLYRKIYYKGHYTGRKLERRHLEAQFATELETVRDQWNKSYNSMNSQAEDVITHLERQRGPIFRKGMYLGAGFAIALYCVLETVKYGLR